MASLTTPASPAEAGTDAAAAAVAAVVETAPSMRVGGAAVVTSPSSSVMRGSNVATSLCDVKKSSPPTRRQSRYMTTFHDGVG